MLSTDHRKLSLVAALAVAGLALTACGSGSGNAHASTSGTDLKIEEVGTVLHRYSSLAEVANTSSALIVAEPTGKTTDVPLPEEQGGTEDTAPTAFIEMKVDQVLSGDVSATVINVVAPGTDSDTGDLALTQDGPFLLYITPAMYAANEPVLDEGYVVTAGPQGVYESTGLATYAKVDDESALPSVVDVKKAKLPAVTKTEKQLLAAGPK